ncbi:MAG: NnrS family protein [Burkholderiales bacterium]|nr:NnrS family protein [Burkholderiales bacterium]
MGNFALWNLGFRPFYLLASVFGVLTILLWIAQLSGLLTEAYLQGPLWHGHEMLFGYTLAVVAGFLLTAVRAWTGEPTPTGAPLMALAALWVAGRVLVLTSYGELAAVANAAFPAALALAIAVPLWRSRNTRNYFFVGLLLLMAALVAILHLTLLGVIVLPPRASLVLGLDVMLFIMAVIGGRVIPMFTNNGVPGAGATRQLWLERLALASIMLLFVADLLQPGATAIAVVALVATLAHGLRLLLWRPWRTLSTPLVWILHAAYAWIVVYLALRAFAAVGWVAETHAIHALTVGAIGGMTLGMMVRTARGHTARPLRADGFELACFLLIQVAALGRVFGAMIFPAAYLPGIQISGLLWAAAFGIYAVRYWPVLTRPRLDGKPG